MKRRTGVFLFSCVVVAIMLDALLPRLRKPEELQVVCSLQGWVRLKDVTDASDAPPSAQAAVRWIAAVAGISPNFVLLKAKFANTSTAFAVIGNNKRYIVYDEQIFSPTSDTITWGQVLVLAHEAAHHIAGHTNRDLSFDSHVQELEADRFSGYVASLLGARLDQALSFTDRLAEEDSKTHPGKSKRRAAISEGWYRARSIRSGNKPT